MGVRKRYLVVDDHPLFRRGLIELLKRDERYELFGEAGDSARALDICKMGRPDIAFVDIALNGQSGLELIKSLHALYPALPILVISMHDESLYAERVLRAGARGYIMKQEASAKIIQAIGDILAGKLFVSESIRDRIIALMFDAKVDDSSSLVGSLSDRELEVFELIGEGNGPAEIAASLNISVKTVEAYREHIKAKLRIPRASELRKFAITWAQEKSKA